MSRSASGSSAAPRPLLFVAIGALLFALVVAGVVVVRLNTASTDGMNQAGMLPNFSPSTARAIQRPSPSRLTWGTASD